MILVFCAAITVLALAYVFSVPDALIAGPEVTRAAYRRERKEVVYENLRDLNFEFKAGKVPDADYHSMKSSLEAEAAAILAELSQLEFSPGTNRSEGGSV
jgi:hypothetical protein